MADWGGIGTTAFVDLRWSVGEREDKKRTCEGRCMAIAARDLCIDIVQKCGTYPDRSGRIVFPRTKRKGGREEEEGRKRKGGREEGQKNKIKLI